MTIKFAAALVAGAAWLALGATPVAAQAFTQEKGHGRVITSLLWSNSDKAFDDRGHAVDIPDYRMTEVYFLGEYGITDDVTLVVTPSLRNVDVKGGSKNFGLGYTDVGGRWRVAHSDRGVFSLQAVARIPGRKRSDAFAQAGQTDMEYDLRAQGGITFGKGSFAIVEGGYRLRAGDPPNAFNLDATLGIRATPRLLLLASTFNTVSDGAGRGVFRRYRYDNVYLSGAYDVSRHITVQLGALGTASGRNALRQRGLLTGLWYRF